MRNPIKLLRVHPDAMLPKRATPGSFGFDLTNTEPIAFEPGQTKIVGTGWKLAAALPMAESAEGGQVGGIAMLILPRSSLGLKYGLCIENSPGLIDADYTGEIGLVLRNFSPRYVSIPAGIKLAQLITSFVDFFPFVEVVEAGLRPERGGFGSTGV